MRQYYLCVANVSPAKRREQSKFFDCWLFASRENPLTTQVRYHKNLSLFRYLYYPAVSPSLSRQWKLWSPKTGQRTCKTSRSRPISSATLRWCQLRFGWQHFRIRHNLVPRVSPGGAGRGGLIPKVWEWGCQSLSACLAFDSSCAILAKLCPYAMLECWTSVRQAFPLHGGRGWG